MKKSGEKEATPKKKAEFVIPRVNPLLNGDSEDESIGTELPFTSDNVAKFWNWWRSYLELVA